MAVNVLIQKYTIIRLLKVFGAFMKREPLLPCSEKHAFRPYPDPVQTCPNRSPPNLMYIVILSPNPPLHSLTKCCNAFFFPMRCYIFFTTACLLHPFMLEFLDS